VLANKRSIGNKGEDMAIRILQKEGYRILDRNFSCSLGEIDIIATKDNTLVFVEVKLRRNSRFGNPYEAVTKYKLQKIKNTGLYYQKIHKNLPKRLRIDVVSLKAEANDLFRHQIIHVDE
jgi:putative endonuclease